MKRIKKTAVIVFNFIIMVMLASGCSDKSDSQKEIITQHSQSQQNKENDFGKGEIDESEAGNADNDDESQKNVDTEKEYSVGDTVGDDASQDTSGSTHEQQTEVKNADTKNTGESGNTQNSSGNTGTKQTESNSTAAKQTIQPTQSTTQPATTKAPIKQEPDASSQNVTLPITVSDKALNSASTIISSITTASMSEFEKVKAIHDYIVINVDYPSVIDMGNRALFTAEGALVNKLAVCQGYAEAFSLLCYKAGIQTEMVYGTAQSGSNRESHAWNLVRVDGVWYQMDVTWDDPVGLSTASGANMQYKYFLIPDSIMNKNHFADSYTHQYSCTDSRYVEYGEQMTVVSYIKSTFGNVKYDFASSEAEVKTIALNNHKAGIKNYVIAYNMGVELGDSTSSAVSAKVDEVLNWVLNSGISGYTSAKANSGYIYGNKYVAINIILQ